MTPKNLLIQGIEPALKLLPEGMTSKQAKVAMLAIAYQESDMRYRYQLVSGRPGAKGPARGYYEFELGTAASRGGVYGVFLHQASAPHLKAVCEALDFAFEPNKIWESIEYNDVLASAVARLLMYTDPKALPAITDAAGCWQMYLRLWRPGKPRPETWAANHRKAVEAVA